MQAPDIFSDEFMQAIAAAGRNARERALAGGHPVVFRDDAGRHVQEMPDGRKFEIRFRPGMSRESHIEIVRELTNTSD